MDSENTIMSYSAAKKQFWLFVKLNAFSVALCIIFSVSLTSLIIKHSFEEFITWAMASLLVGFYWKAFPLLYKGALVLKLSHRIMEVCKQTSELTDLYFSNRDFLLKYRDNLFERDDPESEAKMREFACALENFSEVLAENYKKYHRLDNQLEENLKTIKKHLGEGELK